MKQWSWRPLIWDAAFILILLSVLTVASLITLSFVMVPLIYMRVKLSRIAFTLHFAGCMLLLYLIAGSIAIFPLVLALFFLLPAIIMGNQYRRKSAARQVITLGMVTLIAEMLAALFIVYLSGINVMKHVTDFMMDSVTMLDGMWEHYLSKDLLDQVIHIAVQLLPFWMICTAAYYSIVSHWIARKLLNRAGEAIPGMPPIRKWMLPKALVWYYLLALIIDMFFKTNVDTTLGMILLNLIPLLTLVFSVQAIGFLFFVSYEKRWSKALPIAGMIMFILFPPSQYVLSMLGLIDVAFPMRERIAASK